MKYLMLLSIAALALVGCNTPNQVEGRLAVNSTIKVRTNRDKIVTIAPATHKAVLDIKSNSAEVDIYTSEGKHSFLVPGVRPGAYGNISMGASALGQGANRQCENQNKCDWEQVPVLGTEDIHEVGTH